jgi:GR25 family glycosyltransferase involved in LPS biosynthesis
MAFSIKGIEFANKGYFINLSKCLDRLKHVNELIEKYNISNLNRFDALSDEWRNFSCTKSHLGIFKEALEDDLDIIFVAEDDFNIKESCGKHFTLDESLQSVSEQLKQVEWDVVCFGCTPRTHLIPITTHLAINHKSTGSWGYLIKKKAYQYILQHSDYKKDTLAIDDYLPLLNTKGFVSLCTIPCLFHHSDGFSSTMTGKENDIANYSQMIEGYLDKYIYENITGDYVNEYRVERNVTVVITGHFVDNFLYYLRYLLHSLPKEFKKCKFLVIYDTHEKTVDYHKMKELEYYLQYTYHDINYEVLFSNYGLIDSFQIALQKIKTDYFLFLEHDWVFLKNDMKIKEIIDSFMKYSFINSVYFNKDINEIKSLEICEDVNHNITPFIKEERVTEVDLITTVRWFNNPFIGRVNKYKEWFNKFIKNDCNHHQGQHNIEETMIRVYRNEISLNVWEDIKDNWGTFLYGKLNEGPFMGHLDGSRRYQNENKNISEYSADEYVKNNALPQNY